MQPRHPTLLVHKVIVCRHPRHPHAKLACPVLQNGPCACALLSPPLLLLLVVADATDVAIFPPALFLDSVKSTLRKDWIVGAQNCWKQTVSGVVLHAAPYALGHRQQALTVCASLHSTLQGFGAYTGELTPTMLKGNLQRGPC